MHSQVRRRAINAKSAAVLEEPLRSQCHPEVIRDVEIAAAQTPEQVGPLQLQERQSSLGMSYLCLQSILIHGETCED